MSNKVLLLAIFSLFLVSFSFADSMWYDFTNDYAVDGNAKLNVYVDADGDGNSDAGYDVNVIVHIGDQNFVLNTNTGSNGYAEFNFDFNHEGYLETNGSIVQLEIFDINNDINKTIEFYQPEFKDMDLNWQVEKVLDIEQDANIIFNPVFYDENGNVDSSFDGNFKVYLFDPNGTFVGDYNVYPDQNVEIPFTDFNDLVGKYKIMIGSLDGDENNAGYKTFTFDVQSFKLVSYVQDAEMEESKSAFGTSEALELVAFAIDLNGDILTLDNLYYQIDNEALVEYNSIDTKTIIPTILDELSVGSHKVLVIGTIGDYNQSINLQFDFLDYGSDALMKKNENAGTKERFSGAYAPDSNTTFFFGVKDFEENDYTTFDESDCNALLSGLEYSKPGFKSKVEIEDFDVNYNSNQSLCEVTFTAPATEGEYVYTLDLNEDFNADFGDNLDAEIKLDVQKYNLFLDPIDTESAIDETTGEVDKKADKFEFFDENIGFVVNVVNLQDGTTGEDLNVSAIDTLQIIDGGVAYTLEPEDFDYNYQTKFLIIDKDASEMQSVSGGFEVQATFDTNSDETALLKSYGASKKKTFRISVDLNMSAYDGPPYVTPDKNAVLVVNASNSSDSALDYVNVTVTRIYDFESMQEIDLSTLNGYGASGDSNTVNNLTAITDSSGIAYFNLGSDLNTGMYEITVDVNDGITNDEGVGFFMVKNFFAFGFPGDRQGNGTFLENAYIGRNEIIDIATFVFSGTGAGFGGTEFADISDYSIVSGTAKLFYETEDGTGRKQIDANVAYSGEDVNWTKGSGDMQVTDPGKMARITPDRNLIPGIYEAIYDVNYFGSEPSGVIDTAITRFTIQGFGIQVCNYTETSVSCGESMMGEGGPGSDNTASPDSNILFVLNGSSSGDATLTISLIDEKSFSTVSGAEDMNYYLCDRSPNCTLRYTDANKQFNVNSNAQDNNHADDQNIKIVLPSNVPLGEYEVLFDFVKAGVHTKYSRFITIKQFNIVIPTDMGGSKESRYVEDWENGGVDTNILDTDNWWINQLCNGRNPSNNFVIDGIDYNTFYHPMMSGQSDVNYPMLIDLDNKFIYIDSDWDCNFVNDLNFVSGDKNAHSELMNDGNSVLFTSVTLQSVKHMLIPADTESSNGDMQNNWLGEFDVGRDIILAMVITDVDGNPIEDVNVVVNRVKKIDFLNGNMETLTSGYTVVNDNNTDENGVVFIKINVEETGEYQLELIMTDSQGRREKLMPWDGPVFQIKKFSSEFGVVGEARYNNQLITVDLNSPSSDLVGLDQGINFYGDYNEAVYGDIDGNTDSNKTFYFIYDSTYYNRFNLDDDINFGEYEGSESYGMKRTDLGSTWPTCLGDYNADITDGQQNDCINSNAIMQASSEEYYLNVDLMDTQNKNGSFEDYNVTTTVPREYISPNDGNYWTDDVNKYDGNRALKYSGTTQVRLNDGINISELNEDYNLNFYAFATADTNMRFVLSYDGEDGNKYYNFILNQWDANIGDVNSDYKQLFAVSSIDWNYYSIDFNIEDVSQLYITFIGDENNDVNFYVDLLKLDANLTTQRVSFYNRTSYRLLPSDLLGEVDDQFASSYMIWSNSDVSDTNHYMEISITDRLRADLNISNDANVTATLLKRGTCAMMNGPMMMTYMGQFTSERITGIDSWVFNFGDLGTGISSNCLMYDMRVDISADVGGTVYKDTAWNNFFIRNNEAE